MNVLEDIKRSEIPTEALLSMICLHEVFSKILNSTDETETCKSLMKAWYGQCRQANTTENLNSNLKDFS